MVLVFPIVYSNPPHFTRAMVLSYWYSAGIDSHRVSRRPRVLAALVLCLICSLTPFGLMDWSFVRTSFDLLDLDHVYSDVNRLLTCKPLKYKGVFSNSYGLARQIDII